MVTIEVHFAERGGEIGSVEGEGVLAAYESRFDVSWLTELHADGGSEDRETAAEAADSAHADAEAAALEWLFSEEADEELLDGGMQQAAATAEDAAVLSSSAAVLDGGMAACCAVNGALGVDEDACYVGMSHSATGT